MPKRLKTKIRKKPYAAWRFLGILLILGLLSFRLDMWNVVTSSNNQTSQNSFASNIKLRDSSLEQSFEVYANTLYSGRALMATDSVVSRTDWTNFVNAQNIIQRYPGVYGIAYFKVINKTQAPSLVNELNAQKYSSESSVSIFPQSNDSQLAVLSYIAPSTADQKLIGYDIYSDPVRAAALYRARDSGTPQATAPISLISDMPVTSSNGLLLAMPVYDPSQPIKTIAERQDSLTGYIVLGLHTTPLLDSVFKQPYENNVSVRIVANGKTIYKNGKQWEGTALKKTVFLKVAGQTWQLSYSAPSTLGLETTSKITPNLLLLSVVPLILFYLLAFYFSIRYYTLRRHHKEHHDDGDDLFDLF